MKTVHAFLGGIIAAGGIQLACGSSDPSLGPREAIAEPAEVQTIGRFQITSAATESTVYTTKIDTESGEIIAQNRWFSRHYPIGEE